MRSLTPALALGFAVACTACAAADPSLARAYADGRSHVEVQTRGTVVRVLGDRVGPSGEHVGFLIRADDLPRRLVRVEVNEDLTGPVAVRAGEPVTLRGEYAYDSRGGVIHWTHHDPRHRHPDGFVLIGGHRYE